MGAAGALTLLVQGAQTEGITHASWQGDLMVLLNAASYGVYLVVVKPLMAKYRPLTVISWVFLFGGLMALPVGLPQAMAIDWASFDGGDWSAVAFVVLCTTFLVYLLNIYALGRVQSTVVSIYIYLQPLLATGLSWWVSQRGGADYTADLSGWTALCAVAIFAGVALVSLPSQVRG